MKHIMSIKNGLNFVTNENNGDAKKEIFIKDQPLNNFKKGDCTYKYKGGRLIKCVYDKKLQKWIDIN